MFYKATLHWQMNISSNDFRLLSSLGTVDGLRIDRGAPKMILLHKKSAKHIKTQILAHPTAPTPGQSASVYRCQAPMLSTDNENHSLRYRKQKMCSKTSVKTKLAIFVNTLSLSAIFIAVK